MWSSLLLTHLGKREGQALIIQTPFLFALVENWQILDLSRVKS